MSRRGPESASPVKRLEETVEDMEAFVEQVLVEVEGEPANNARKKKLERTTIHDLRQTLAVGRKTFENADRVIAEVKADLEQERADNEERWKRREDRKDVRTVLEAEERRRTMRQDDVLLVLTVISVLATIAMAFLTVKHREPWHLGPSLVGALLSGGGVFLLRAERPARRN